MKRSLLCCVVASAARPLYAVAAMCAHSCACGLRRYTGGVGSFLLLLMAMRVLQVCNREGARGALERDPSLGVPETSDDADGERKKKKKKKKKKNKKRKASGPEAIAARAAEISQETGTNLGTLLLSFLELYGHSLNFVKTGLSVQGHGSFYSKRDRQWYACWCLAFTDARS